MSSLSSRNKTCTSRQKFFNLEAAIKVFCSCPILRDFLKKKGFLKNFSKFTGKHLCQSLLFNKVAGVRPATLLIKRLWYRCSPVNFEKSLRKPFFFKKSRKIGLEQKTLQVWIYVFYCSNCGMNVWSNVNVIKKMVWIGKFTSLAYTSGHEHSDPARKYFCNDWNYF